MGLTPVYILLILVTYTSASYPGKKLSICNPWVCINEKLNVTGQGSNGSLTFERSRLSAYLTTHLTDEKWRKPVDRALDACLNPNKPRRYSMTCPGQEIWHCVVDQLIDNCPETNLLKEDACTPVASLLGVKYLFSVNTYLDIERNILKDHRPSWFLRNYLRSKCCKLPTLFEESVMAECGVTKFMNVRTHEAVQRNQPWLPRPPGATGQAEGDSSEPDCGKPIEDVNPLECCDANGLISPSAINECGFLLQWDTERRLTLKQKSVPPTTTNKAAEIEKVPQKKVKSSDLAVLPLSCEKETCVFKKLNVVLADGSVDRDAFSRVLDNFTELHPSWTSAKARVLTRCLNRRHFVHYDEQCEINKILACTFDVLSENCPTAKKISADPCRRPSVVHNATAICQISSSKFKKSRRHFCDFPRLVHQAVLEACGMTSLSRMQVFKDTSEAPAEAKPHQYGISKLTPCANTGPSTTCVLDKMGVLNKYRFLDTYKMKEKIDDFTTRDVAWAPQKSQLALALASAPNAFYKEHCLSTRKILNVLDSVVMNCPASNRKNTEQCAYFYKHIDKCNRQPPTEPATMFHRNPVASQTPVVTKNPILVQFLNSNKTILVHMPHYKPIPPPQMSVPYSPILHYPRVAFPNRRTGVVPVAPEITQNFPYMSRPPAHLPRYYWNGNQPLLYKDNFRNVNRPYHLHEKIAAAHSKSKSGSKVFGTFEALESGVGIRQPMMAAGPGV